MFWCGLIFFLFKLILTGNCVEHNSKDEAQSVGEIRDNRALVDNNTAQSLSSEDIEALRRLGFLFVALE